MRAYATNYGGYRSARGRRQLGDGRAIFLGEVLNRDGQRFELQLKGAGRTPVFAPRGRAGGLRSSIREFCCAARHDAPSWRADNTRLVAGDHWDRVRDMFYDGHPVDEPGAIVCRVAPSFLRFGHFELPPSRGDEDLLRQLFEFTIARDFPHSALPPEERVALLHVDICERTARLMVTGCASASCTA